jgi:predicted kinase
VAEVSDDDPNWPCLIVLRGNSGSGKSTVASEIRARYGRGLALVGQDNLRRVVLREREVAGGANIGLIDLVARYAAGSGYHVVVDGILRAEIYAEMLAGLRRDHRGRTYFYYLHVPFEETMRRHATRPQAAEFGPVEMSTWYRELDLLPGGIEQIIPASSPLEATVTRIMSDTGLLTSQAESEGFSSSTPTARRSSASSRPLTGFSAPSAWPSASM